MTTITATPQAATASILLQVSGAPAGAVSLTRVDANGAAAVRLRENQAPIGGSLTIVDNEAALVGLLRYDVKDAANATVSASATLAGLVPLPQLTVPVLSTLGVELEMVLDYGASYPSTGSVHDVVKGTAPIPNLGPLGARRGQLELYAADYTAALRIVSCYSRGHVVMLRQPTIDGLDLYHVADGQDAVRVAPDQGRWRVAVNYREVRSPSAPQMGVAGWTYADLSAAYPSYAAVRAAFGSYADLAAGTPS